MISGLMKLIAKKPSTTLGTPAITSRIGLRKRRTLGLAYSERYTAAPNPSGMATNMAIPVTMKVPTIRVLMSKLPRTREPAPRPQLGFVNLREELPRVGDEGEHDRDADGEGRDGGHAQDVLGDQLLAPFRGRTSEVHRRERPWRQQRVSHSYLRSGASATLTTSRPSSGDRPARHERAHDLTHRRRAVPSSLASQTPWVSARSSAARGTYGTCPAPESVPTTPPSPNWVR